ncbi:MAG TPA: hypothetical protein VN018_03705 [Brevundimonas sp.]|nr:hypothetical protein [Brevundimonas sp.]
MSAFEFFFSFYGLVLGLSVTVIATGLATAIQHRKRIRIGWLTPLLALFVGLDVASFWDFAWTNFRDLPFSYGLLIVGLAIALIYFIAASLVFPHAIEDDLSLDDHFWANKKLVLLLTTVANVAALVVALPIILSMPGGVILVGNYAVTLFIYIALVLPAAFTRNKTVFATLMTIHIVIYLLIGAFSAAVPNSAEMLEAMAAGQAAAPATAPAK